MGRGAVSLQRSIVLVLFVNEEPARLGFMPMYLIQQAAGFLAGFLSQFGEQTDNIRLTTDLRHPRHRQHDHRSLRSQIFACALVLDPVNSWSFAANSSRNMVSSRPGPVETMPMRAPLSFSTKARYSRAACGSFSSFVIPWVEVRQPGIFR